MKFIKKLIFSSLFVAGTQTFAIESAFDHNLSLIVPKTALSQILNNNTENVIRFSISDDREDDFSVRAIKWKTFKANFSSETLSIKFPDENISVQSEPEVYVSAGVVCEDSLYIMLASNPRVQDKTSEEIYEEFLDTLSNAVKKQFKIQISELDGNHIVDGKGDLGLLDDEDGNSPGEFNHSFRFVFTAKNVYLLISAVDLDEEGYHDQFIKSFKVVPIK